MDPVEVEMEEMFDELGVLRSSKPRRRWFARYECGGEFYAVVERVRPRLLLWRCCIAAAAASCLCRRSGQEFCKVGLERLVRKTLR